MKNKTKEKMLVKVELSWGYVWNGNHYEQTKGKGQTAQVSEHHSNRKNGFSFSGCPLGRTTGMSFSDDQHAIDFAIDDFINYGKSEYLGKDKLTRDMIEIVETIDWRKI